MRARTLKSIAMIVGAALGAVLIGLVGSYFVLPAIDPTIAAGGQSEKTVTTARDSTAAQTSTSKEDETDGAARDTMARNTMAGKDSMTRQDEDDPAGEHDGSSTASTMTSPSDSSSTARLRALRDSIDILRRRLQEAEEAADTLREETARLRGQLATAEAERTKVDELSSALMDMRRRNLGNLLQEVDMGVLKKLYQETSGRARTRLLQSLAPDQAAQFVNQVVENDVESAATVATDSTVSTE